MNKSHTKKIVIEVGKLPSIISEKKVFAEMTIPEKRAFYKHLNENLEEIGFNCHQDNYKKMCLYPEEKLNKAFLENKFRNVEKWHVYVNAITNSLEEHLIRSLRKKQEEYKALTTDVQRAHERIVQMQSDIEKYIPKSA